jgi:hypothetical protein
LGGRTREEQSHAIGARIGDGGRQQYRLPIIDNGEVLVVQVRK